MSEGIIGSLKKIWQAYELSGKQDKRIDISKERIKKLELERKNFLTLQKITATLVSNLNFEYITQKIVDVVVKDFEYAQGALFLVNNEEKYIYCHSVSKTYYIEKALKLLNKSFTEYHTSFDEKTLVLKTILTGNIFIDKYIRNFICPTVSEKFANFSQKIARIKINISLPITVKGVTIGALTFSSKNECFTEEEITILKTFANQAGIAINNARQYEQIQTQNKSLQEKTQDLKSLLDISEIAASSLEARSITQKIVDGIPEKFRHLGYLGAILTMYDSKTDRVSTYCITESELVQKKVNKILDKPFKNYSSLASASKTLTVKAIKTGKMQLGDKAGDFVSPPVNINIAKLIQRAVGIKACAALPIFVRGEVIGACIFVTNKSLKEISSRDTELMIAIVNHIGVSIDNAILFDKTVKQVKELEHAKEKLEQTLAMKGEFVHIVSHQLRTPLTVVRGLISMWYDGDFDKLPEDKQKDFRERIKISAEKLNNITNQMLKAMEFEGSVKLNIAQVDLLKVIKSAIDLLKPNFDKKKLYLKLENKTRKKEIFIEADANYIPHIFNNLIDNAEKYTFKGGVTVTLGSRGNYVCVKIQDTGVGITKENQERLFKKFSRGVNALKDNPSGSGLGLFIAKQIVSEHRGKIVFDSAGENKGTLFTVTLPIKQVKE